MFKRTEMCLRKLSPFKDYLLSLILCLFIVYFPLVKQVYTVLNIKNKTSKLKQH